MAITAYLEHRDAPTDAPPFSSSDSGPYGISDDVRLSQRQQIIVTTKLRWPISKALTAEIRFLQFVTLDHGAHRTIKNNNTFRQQGC